MPPGPSPPSTEAWNWENAAAGATAGFATVATFHPLDVVRTRFQDALRTILKEEGWRALYRGIGPGLLLVTHGAIQFTAYEELRKAMIFAKSKQTRGDNKGSEDLLNSIDYAALGAGSKLSAILLTYPYQVIRARLQQRPGSDGIPKYSDSWHVVKETGRYEGVRGFYRGITSNLLKNLPAASVTFVVYENVTKLFRAAKEKT